MFKKVMSAVALLMSLPVVGLVFVPVVVNAGERVQYTTESRPRQECRTERVANLSGGNEGAIIGGIAGGLLGNQVGGGSGKVVATAVGAATGAVVGDRLTNQGTGFHNEQRCRTVYDQVRVRVVDAPVVRTVTRVVEFEEGHHDKHHHKHHKHNKHHKHHKHHDKHDRDHDD